MDRHYEFHHQRNHHASLVFIHKPNNEIQIHPNAIVFLNFLWIDLHAIAIVLMLLPEKHGIYLDSDVYMYCT